MLRTYNNYILYDHRRLQEAPSVLLQFVSQDLLNDLIKCLRSLGYKEARYNVRMTEVGGKVKIYVYGYARRGKNKYKRIKAAVLKNKYIILNKTVSSISKEDYDKLFYQQTVLF
jgi:triacylglycerol esterase/lipase EstA (alpha/beta hydrolase family)